MSLKYGGTAEGQALRFLWPFSWSKFKAALTLKGPDGVLLFLPSGSLIFAQWTAVLSTDPHPTAFAGSELVCLE